uniref:Methyltransferase small domain-containing protein n=1 Tax=Tetradesmus obliquus TaxID=3088 RepID=A0A383WPV8_TETOB
MKLKELHALMQDIEPFAQPKVQLEQYPTGADIASRMLYTIESMFNAIEGNIVVDLGTGTGMLAIGAALLGSPCVVGLDVDADALQVAHDNCEQFEDPLPLGSPCVVGLDVGADALQVAHDNCEQFEDPLPIDFVLCDVNQLQQQQRLQADTVIMNPPFGTKMKGADMAFLRAACSLGPKQIYSLNKSSTRSHIQKVALKELGCTSAEVLAELRYNLPATMRFHKQASVDIEVDLWRFELPAAAAAAAAGGYSSSEGDDEEDQSDNA